MRNVLLPAVGVVACSFLMFAVFLIWAAINGSAASVATYLLTAIGVLLAVALILESSRADRLQRELDDLKKGDTE